MNSQALLDALRAPGFLPIGHQTGALAVAAVLTHGRTYSPAPLVRGMRRRPGACFEACAQFVLRADKASNVRYVEGFAMRPSLTMPIAHAWLTIDGEAFDITWQDLSGRGNADCLYRGIEFTTKAVGEIIHRNDYYGLLDPADEFVLSRIAMPVAA